MVDSGCTRTIVHASRCTTWRSGNVVMTQIGGSGWRCQGTASVCVAVDGGDRVDVVANVSRTKPFGFECVLGMDAITKLGGATIVDATTVLFGALRTVSAATVDSCASARSGSELRVDERDFSAVFNRKTRCWTMAWKWRDEQEPEVLKNTKYEYAVPPEARQRYEKEVQDWIDRGWLQLYDEDKCGPAKGLVPLMAVVQPSKDKVRPVLDFREVNTYIDAYTGDADVCADKLREWRKMGARVTMVDLAKAYLQVRVEESLWPYQTVVFKGKRYCLTRLGFGLNVAPLVMKAVLNKVLEQNSAVRAGTSAYVDDVLVREDVVAVTDVVAHLEEYGLSSKQPESMWAGARALGLQVWGEKNTLQWCRSGSLPDVPQRVTRRDVFSICGKLVSHYPVCGWLRVSAGFIKRKASRVTDHWDDVVTDGAVVQHLRDTVAAVKENDPVKGRWDVAGKRAVVWVDASSLALGAAVEIDGCVVEDASWLRKDEAGHINMAELDAVIKGLNLVLAWQMKEVEIKTDSATVHQWISDGLTGKSRLKTKAANEMLIRRRVAIVTALVEEYKLQVTVSLVPSHANKADSLTRVPEKWLREVGVPAASGAVVENSLHDRIKQVHHEAGHPGVRRTLYFARRQDATVGRQQVRDVVRECDTCKSIDPAPVKWQKGQLSVRRVWQRVGMDITHCGGQHYLTLIDCGPSRFAIWRRLRMQTSECVTEQLESIFWERGAPEEILTDNDTAFKSKKFAEFATRWNVRLRFRCAYVASGNGVAERCHRTVKVIAARKQCAISEAVYLYNVTPRDDCGEETAPANVLYQYVVRVRGVDKEQQEPQRDNRMYRVGDAVWVKPPGGRCNTRFGPGKITGIVSPHAVEVDGMARHVRDVRARSGVDATPIDESASDEDDWDWFVGPRQEPVRDEEDEPPAGPGQDVAEDGGPRRSARIAARTQAYKRCPCDSDEPEDRDDD